MPATSTKHTIIKVRLTAAEYELLQQQADPNMTAWIREQIRKLPGGDALPPVEKVAPPVKTPPWPPEPIFAGGAPGKVALQTTAFIEAVKLASYPLAPQQWWGLHGIYEGLKSLVTKRKLDAEWHAANRWGKSGKPPLPNAALYEALLKFGSLRDAAWGWYVKKYKISNAKRQRALAKDREGVLARQRESMAKTRAKQRSSAAALERAAREREIFQTFVADHVTDDRAPDSVPVAAE